MKVTIQRPKGFLLAFGRACMVKPVKGNKRDDLANVLLDGRGLGYCIRSTDGMRTRLRVPLSVDLVDGDIDQLLLPREKFTSILATSGLKTPMTLTLTKPGKAEPSEVVSQVATHFRVKTETSTFNLPCVDPYLYPWGDDDPVPPHATSIAAHDLRRLIVQTSFATDVESTRYALGSVLAEVDGHLLRFVATDGRRLAIASAPADHNEIAGIPDRSDPPTGLMPVGALKNLLGLLDLCDPDDQVRLAIRGKSSMVADCHAFTLEFLLGEGRFPRYADAIPDGNLARARLDFAEVGPLAEAVSLSRICTTDDVQGATWEIRPGETPTIATKSEAGESLVQARHVEVRDDSKPTTVDLGAEMLSEALKAIPSGQEILIEVHSAKEAVRIVTEGFEFVQMPLIKQDPVIAAARSVQVAEGVAG